MAEVWQEGVGTQRPVTESIKKAPIPRHFNQMQRIMVVL
jgi:hypothetical protein